MPIVSLSKTLEEKAQKWEERIIDIVIIVKIYRIFGFPIPIFVKLKKMKFDDYHFKYIAKFRSLGEHFLFVNCSYKGIFNLKKGIIYRV